MARIVCQVLHRPARVTFIWSQGEASQGATSQGEASFEPYHLEGHERDRFLQAARQGHEVLLRSAFERDASMGLELARAGHRLFEALFPPRAGKVRQWLHSQQDQAELEILSDMPGAAPWNILYEQEPSEATWNLPGGAARKAFWGHRYDVGVGRRVNPLQTAGPIEAPSVLLAIDPVVRSQLPAEVKNALVDFARVRQASILESTEELAGAIRARAPDVLFFLSSVDAGGLVLGAGRLSAEDLRDLVAQADEGNPDPLIVLACAGQPAQAEEWQRFLASAVGSLAGVVACETPVPADIAAGFGLDVLSRFLEGGKTLGQALKEARAANDVAALALACYCPGRLRVSGPAETQEEQPPERVDSLPDTPYHPLAPLEREDRAFLVGRADDIARCAGLLDNASTRGLLVHGFSGVGKTSFLRAGLIPHLEDEAVGYRALRDRTASEEQAEAPPSESDCPVIAIIPGSDLTGQIAEALCAFCARPYTYATPAGETVTVDLPATVRQFLRGGLRISSETAITENPHATREGVPEAGRTEESERVPPSPHDLWQAISRDDTALAALLDELTLRLPFELVLVVEQGELLFTQKTDRSAQERRRQALGMLQKLFASPARCKVIVAQRTEHLGRFIDTCPAGGEVWREFLLRALDYDELVEVLTMPTIQTPVPYSNEIPLHRYRFSFDAGVAENLVKEAVQKANGQSPLALVHTMGELLVDLSKKRKPQTIHAHDRKPLGDLDQVVSRLVDGRLRALSAAGVGQNGVRSLMSQLAHVEEGGAVYRVLTPWADAQRTWRSPGSMDDAVAAAAGKGLLEVHKLSVQGREGLFLGLPQDSLAQLQTQKAEEVKRRAFGRTRVFDTLWIMIPLLLLGMAITWTLTRSSMFKAGAKLQDLSDEAKAELNQAIEGMEDKMRASLVWPNYTAQIAKAQLGVENGHSSRVRQMLRNQIPGKKETDLRGFEWFYLWKQIHREQLTLAEQNAAVQCLAISPDGSTLASGGADGVIKLWDLRKDKLKADLVAHEKGVNAVAFSPDGKTLASAGADGVVRLWDGTAGADKFQTVDKPAKKLQGHAKPVLALAFGEGGLASSDEAGKIILWNPATGAEEKRFEDHKSAVRALVMAAGGNLISGGDDRTIHIRKVADGKIVKSIETKGAVQALALDSEAKTVAAGCDEPEADYRAGVVRFYDLATGDSKGKPIRHGTGIFSIAFVSQGKLLFTTGKDYFLRSWNPESGQESSKTPAHFAWVRALAVAPDGGRLATGSSEPALKLWDLASVVRGDAITVGRSPVAAVAFSKNSKLLVSGSLDGSVSFWDAATGASLGAPISHKGSVTSLAFLPSEDKGPLRLAVGIDAGQEAGEVKIWDITIGAKGFEAKESRSLKKHSGGVLCLGVSSDGKLLASGGADGVANLWDSKTGDHVKTLDGHKGAVRCLAFALAEGGLITGDAGGFIHVWDPATGKREEKVEAHPGGVNALAYFYEELAIVTAGADNTVKFWIKRPAEAIKSFKEIRISSEPPSCLAVSPGSKFAVIGCLDATLNVTDLVPQTVPYLQTRIALAGHAGPVRAVAISPSRLTIASAGVDGVIRLWRAAPESAVQVPVPEREDGEQ